VTRLPPWYLDPDSEDTLCRCGHQGVSHEAVFGLDHEVTYPCTEDEHFDVGPDGRMILVEEPCPCEDYTPG
jgi:hypothetical protein